MTGQNVQPKGDAMGDTSSAGRTNSYENMLGVLMGERGLTRKERGFLESLASTLRPIDRPFTKEQTAELERIWKRIFRMKDKDKDELRINKLDVLLEQDLKAVIASMIDIGGGITNEEHTFLCFMRERQISRLQMLRGDIAKLERIWKRIFG